MKDRQKMKDFLLTIVLEGLEGKYEVRLSRGNNKCLFVTLDVVINFSFRLQDHEKQNIPGTVT